MSELNSSTFPAITNTHLLNFILFRLLLLLIQSRAQATREYLTLHAKNENQYIERKRTCRFGKLKKKKTETCHGHLMIDVYSL